MTGEDSYHAHCFNCRVCKKRIDELVFAKTSQGIYCMPCHNERVARSRKHHERREKEKREKERKAAAATQGPGSAGVPLNVDGNLSLTQDGQMRMIGNAVRLKLFTTSFWFLTPYLERRHPYLPPTNLLSNILLLVPIQRAKAPLDN
jgi:hypothetical protein